MPDDVIDATVNHAEKIGEHAERLNVLETATGALSSVVNETKNTVDEIATHTRDLTEAQLRVVDEIASLRAERAAQLEVASVEKAVEPTGEKTPTETPTESVEAPPAVVAENKKKSGPLSWFHEIFG